MLMEADLPSDVEALRALVLEQARELDALKEILENHIFRHKPASAWLNAAVAEAV